MTATAMPQAALRQITGNDGVRHYALPNGRLYVSSTTALKVINKEALQFWYAKVEREMVLEVSADLYADLPLDQPKRMSRAAYIDTLQKRVGKQKAATKKLKAASDIGTAAHARVEWELRNRLGQKQGPEPIVQGPAMWAFQAWLKWWDQEGFTPVAIEQQVWSDTYRYAGTMDLLALNRASELCAIDWKTGKAIYPEAALQIVSYGNAVDEMGHGPVKRHLIARLPKTEHDPGFEVRRVKDPDKSFKAFLHALELWSWQQDCADDMELHAEDGAA